MLNVQLDRLPAMIRAMRRQKKPHPEGDGRHGPASPCARTAWTTSAARHVMYTLPTHRAGRPLRAASCGGVVCGKTGRHVYTEWDPIFAHRGAHHPALDPFKLPANAGAA